MFFEARLLENQRLGAGNFILHLAGCDALADAQPGQFVMLRGAWGRDPLLPRAFSILRTRAGGECEILVKAMGHGSRLLEPLEAGARLSVLGPLGMPFPAPTAARRDLLVAGGVGLAPLLWHAERACAAGVTVELFYGARAAADLVLLDVIASAGCRLELTTDDGSHGLLGPVTRALEARLLEGGGLRPTILTCGPNAMMRAVVAIARRFRLDCLVSVEGEMACGIGVCLGCAVPLTGGDRPFAYACLDGPVFDAARIEIP